MGHGKRVSRKLIFLVIFWFGCGVPFKVFLCLCCKCGDNDDCRCQLRSAQPNAYLLINLLSTSTEVGGREIVPILVSLSRYQFQLRTYYLL
jgi:hypothetical protein